MILIIYGGYAEDDLMKYFGLENLLKIFEDVFPRSCYSLLIDLTKVCRVWTGKLNTYWGSQRKLQEKTVTLQM